MDPTVKKWFKSIGLTEANNHKTNYNNDFIEQHGNIKSVKKEAGFDPVQVQEKMNFFMMQSLVIEVGTEQMRKYFLKQTGIDKSNVGQFLMQEQHARLKNIKIVADQKQIMYRKDANIKKFDITIMMILIRYCCGVSRPDKFWTNPGQQDNTNLANLVRIQKYRNMMIAHNPDLRIPVVEFENYWKILTPIFKNLGVTVDEINKYRQIV
ncbi:E3 ubiquitin-protein ligase DZIP3-like [Anneissia japonica]|uniref:E3 ubiquitin-protein ligase DZIP3-like n=1 Tax=Anneissia japonica TaxID=1529436 RepID=UPI001425A458|nr:E3 ubiquitin-protein ligase DZIP3-like [Anneissia japonica]